jgi:hypothetical protein
VVTKV